MADRFAEFNRSVNRLQLPLPMLQGTSSSTRGTRLGFRDSLRPSQRQSFRCHLSDRSSQRMPRRLQNVEPHVFTQQAPHIDSKPIRHLKKGFPLLLANPCLRHRCSSLNVVICCLGFPIRPTLTSAYKVFLNSPIDVFSLDRSDRNSPYAPPGTGGNQSVIAAEPHFCYASPPRRPGFGVLILSNQPGKRR